MCQMCGQPSKCSPVLNTKINPQCTSFAQEITQPTTDKINPSITSRQLEHFFQSLGQHFLVGADLENSKHFL
jgi:hypothetical protein